MAARIGWIGRNIATSVASQCWCPQEPMAWYPWVASNERDFFFSVSISGWWFGTFFILHNIWDNPSYWLIFFKMVKTTNQIYNYRTVHWLYIRFQIAQLSIFSIVPWLWYSIANMIDMMYGFIFVPISPDVPHLNVWRSGWCGEGDVTDVHLSSRPFLRKFGTYCADCVIRKTCWLMETFCIVSQFFLSLKVGVNCWAEPPEMRRGCFSAKALPSNPLNVLAATSGTSWDSICWILWFVGLGQNVQIPNQQPIGIDQLWLLLVMAEVPRDVDERVQELHRRLEGSAEENIARHVTGVPQVNPPKQLFVRSYQFHRKFSEWICGYFPKKFVTPCEVPRKVMERFYLRPESVKSVKSVKSQNHHSGGFYGRKSFASVNGSTKWGFFPVQW